MSKDQKEICLYCKWWFPEPSVLKDHVCERTPGKCRFNPPAVVQCGDASGGFYGAGMHPSSMADSFCSKFEDHPDDHE